MGKIFFTIYVVICFCVCATSLHEIKKIEKKEEKVKKIFQEGADKLYEKMGHLESRVNKKIALVDEVTTQIEITVEKGFQTDNKLMEVKMDQNKKIIEKLMHENMQLKKDNKKLIDYIRLLWSLL